MQQNGADPDPTSVTEQVFNNAVIIYNVCSVAALGA